MDNLIEWIFLVTVVLGLLIYVYLVWNFTFWTKRGINGPKPRPLVGNLPGMLTYSQHMVYDLHNIYREYKGQEQFVGFFIARQPRLLILDPNLIREVLISHYKNFQENDIIFPVDKELDRLIAQNPFFLTGAEWKEKRSEITPALTINRIKASYPIMLEVCKKMTRYLELECENPPKDGIEAKDFAARFTIEVVANCVFGLEAGAFTKGECVLREEGAKIFGSNSALDIFYVFMITTFPVIKKIFNYPLISKKSEQFFTNLMSDAVKHREQSKDDRVDFLNYLLQLRDRKNLSAVDMTSHTLSFFIDGFETSSILISHCILALAKHKEVQTKLRQELTKTILEDGELTFEKLIELPYLDSVMNETLRLYPPAGFLSKICTEPHELMSSKGKPVCVEKGVVTVLPIYSIQTDEEYYHDADKFIPERFSAENGGTKKYRDMGVFFPFGDGPRICLGMRFALTQSKAAICELVTNWEMSVNDKTRKEFWADPKNFLFVMEGGSWIDFKKIAETRNNI